jgi:hypothetical protein
MGSNWKKKYTINLDWMVKLKTNKLFTKTKKNRNQKNKRKIEKVIYEKLRLKNKIENK